MWSYNAETLRIADRLEELLRLTGKEEVHIVCIQGTCLVKEDVWICEGHRVFSLPKSEISRHDGCVIAVCTKWAGYDNIRCHHNRLAGRLVGVRVRYGRGTDETDVYVLCGYAPVQKNNVESHAECEKFWSKVGQTISSIPRRCNLVFCVDANSEIGLEMPWVGPAGSAVGLSRWSKNGERLLSLLQDHDLRAP